MKSELSGPSNIRAVIFDMDGVLTDSEPLINAAAMAMFKEKGLVVQPEDFLPLAAGERRADGPLRIGYIGTGYRLEEFRVLWDALVRLSAEYGERLEFEFWGLDVSTLPPLSS